MLLEVSGFGYYHVNTHSEMYEMSRKHNVDYYIKILCMWAHVDDDVEEENEDYCDIEEEDFTHLERNKTGLFFLLSIILFGTILIYEKTR